MTYYDDNETFRICPVCKDCLVCGPPMSSDEKKEMLILNGFTYSNYYKHIFQRHWLTKTAEPGIAELIKGMTDDERHKFIEEKAKELLEAL